MLVSLLLKCRFSRAWFGALGLCHGQLMLPQREQWGLCRAQGSTPGRSCKMYKNLPFCPSLPIISAAEDESAIVTPKWQDEEGSCRMLKGKYLFLSTFLSHFLPDRDAGSVCSCKKAEFSTQWWLPTLARCWGYSRGRGGMKCPLCSSTWLGNIVYCVALSSSSSFLLNNLTTAQFQERNQLAQLRKLHVYLIYIHTHIYIDILIFFPC